MKRQKYRDMAYTNSKGCSWLRLIHQKDIWDKWARLVSRHFQNISYPDKNLPAKILTSAIWHFGFANDRENSKNVRVTAQRLRRGNLPPERGAEVLNRDLSASCVEMRTYGMPLEFWLLENFLENEVRPRMDGATKIE